MELTIKIDQLPSHLGFVVTEEMDRLAISIVYALQNGRDYYLVLYRQYALLGEAIVRADRTYEGGSRKSLGKLIDSALIFRDGCRLDLYLEHLIDVHTDAIHLQQVNVAQVIQTEIDRVNGEIG